MATTSCRTMLGSRLLVPLLCVAVVAILTIHDVEAQGGTGDFTCTAADLATCMINANCTSENSTDYDCVCDLGFDNQNITQNATCLDIDECADGTANCGDKEACINTEGGYDCDCDVGYIMYGNDCVAAGNCSGVSCSDYASCVDGNCTCDPGFEGDGVWCSDIDECLTANCTENATCSNSIGSYQCVCDVGFAGNGTDCQDMCPINICAANATCYISQNGFESCVCNDGYSGDGFISCVDIDDCVGPDACDPYATCTNTDGGFTCTCIPGYYGNGTDCNDVDECDDPFMCADYQDCINYHGNYACVCSDGLVPTESGCRQSLLPILIAVDVLLGVIVLCVVVACCCCCNSCCKNMCCCTIKCKCHPRSKKQPKWSKKYKRQSNPQMQSMPQMQSAPQPQYMPQMQSVPQPQYIARAQYSPQAQYTPQGQYRLQAQYTPQTQYPAQGTSQAMSVQWNNKPVLRMNPTPGQGMNGDCRFRIAYA